MNDKDIELLEKLLEEFCSKSNYCKDCSCKYNDGNRYYCYFGIKCILKGLNFSIDI